MIIQCENRFKILRAVLNFWIVLIVSVLTAMFFMEPMRLPNAIKANFLVPTCSSRIVSHLILSTPMRTYTPVERNIGKSYNYMDLHGKHSSIA